MLIALLFIYAHYVCDFICQTNAMALGKSKSNFWLTMHVITYMAAFILPASMIFWMFAPGVSFAVVCYWVALNGCLHWITDYYTSRWSSSYFSVLDYHNGFNVVGLDQCIHYTCLLLTAAYLIG
jgi:isoprenylcysteine carboxyl methyltransferase (ICMT) family protein YpbQ